MTEQRSEQETTPSAVYIPFKTFQTAIDTLKQALPPTLDRSAWASFAGSTQSQVLSAFKFLGLADKNGAVQPPLKRLVDAENWEQRKPILKELLEKHYASIYALSDRNETFLKLQEEMRKFGVKGGTLEKAIRFFMDASKFADRSVTPQWVNAKKSTPRRKRGDSSDELPPLDRGQGRESPSKPTKGSTQEIKLKSGGTVTLVVSVDLFDLSKEDREWVFGLVDTLKTYVTT